MRRTGRLGKTPCALAVAASGSDAAAASSRRRRGLEPVEAASMTTLSSRMMPHSSSAEWNVFRLARTPLHIRKNRPVAATIKGRETERTRWRNVMKIQIGENLAKKKLRADKLVLCMAVNQLRTPNIAMIAAACGFDAIYVDMEHNPTGLESAAGICVAALGVGITPIVRVNSHQGHEICRALDSGAQGIMIPHVNTAEQARDVVEASLFPPRGHRSAGGTLPVLGYRSMPQGEINALLNRETLLIAMIETPEAVANVNAIAAVDGIDLVHIGASDLSAEMGLAGQYSHPRLHAAYEAVSRATRAHGKAMGIGGVRNDPQYQTTFAATGRALPHQRVRPRLRAAGRHRGCSGDPGATDLSRRGSGYAGQAQLCGAVAAGEMPVAGIGKFRNLGPAPVDHIGAARMEGAARRRCRRIGHFPAQDDTIRSAPWIGLRHRGQQRRRIGVERRGVEAPRRGDLDDAPNIHHGHAVAHVLHHAEVVRHEQVGQAEPVLQFQQQVDDLRLHRDIERRDRLIRHDQLRIERERPRDADTLPLAAAERVREAAERRTRQLHQVEQFQHPFTPFRRIADPVDQERLGNDVAHRHARIERGVRVLEDHLHVPPYGPQPRPRQRHEVDGRRSVRREADLARRSLQAPARCSGRPWSYRSHFPRPTTASRPGRCGS